MLKAVLNFLFPLKCVVCGKLNSKAVCENCWRNLSKTISFRKDLLPLNYAQYSVRSLPVLSLCIYQHTSDFAKLIKRFKYKFTSELGGFFAEKLYELIWHKAPDLLSATDVCLCPVPSSFLRKNWRGYNQAELCASGLSKLTKIPLWLGIKRKNDNQHQVGSNAAQRRKNLKSIFFINKSPPKGINRIIFIDDVITTGSTLRELWLTCLNKHPKQEYSAICLASRLVF